MIRDNNTILIDKVNSFYSTSRYFGSPVQPVIYIYNTHRLGVNFL